MTGIITLTIFVGLIIFSLVSIISIFFLLINRSDYGILWISIINSFILLFTGILFPTVFIVTMEVFFSYNINTLLIRLTLMGESILALFFALDISILREYGEIKLPSFLFISLFFSLLLGTMMIPDKITLSLIQDTLIYGFDNIIKVLIVVYNLYIIGFLIYNSIKIRIISDFKQLSMIILIFTLTLSISIGTFCLYIIFEAVLLNRIFIILLWGSLIIKCGMLWKKPQIYIKLANKIYCIQIYHKSGVMLYSYDFKKDKKNGMALIWGNILIGLNHILSEFVKKDEQIDVFQTKNADIIINYNNELDFAVILKSLNKKNPYMEQCMNHLMDDFAQKYETELEEIKDINKLINVIDFKDTKEIIERNFEIYI